MNSNDEFLLLLKKLEIKIIELQKELREHKEAIHTEAHPHFGHSWHPEEHELS